MKTKSATFVRVSVLKAVDGKWFVRVTRSGRKVLQTETYNRRSTAVVIAKNLVRAAGEELFQYDED